MTGPRLSRPSLASFDLDYLDTLSDSPEFLLSISEQTFYVLLNLVNADVKNPMRYAIGYSDQHYQPVRESDAEWTLYQTVAERVQLEVYDVAEPLTGILEDIRTQQLPQETLSQVWTGSATAVTENYVGNQCPEGEVWRLETMLAEVTTGPCGEIRFQVYVDSSYITIKEINSPAVGTRYTVNVPVWMIYPDRVRIQFRQCTVGTTDLRTEYAGAIFEQP